MSKVFEVELRRTSYIVITVEAENKGDAEEQAWRELGFREFVADATWELESIEELK